MVGTIVAALSSLAPAIRATRVPPMAALREAAAPTVGHVPRRLTIAAALLLVAGFALIALGLFAGGSTNATLVKLGIGALVTFIGVALLSPYLVRPAGLRDRLAGPEASPASRPPGARERDAPARPHRRRRRRR